MAGLAYNSVAQGNPEKTKPAKEVKVLKHEKNKHKDKHNNDQRTLVVDRMIVKQIATPNQDKRKDEDGKHRFMQLAPGK